MRPTVQASTQQRDTADERRRHMVLEAQRAQQAQAERDRDLARQRQREQDRKAARKMAPAQPGPAPAAPVRQARVPVEAADAPWVNLRARLANRGVLRELIVLNEIIEPPVALRRPE